MSVRESTKLVGNLSPGTFLRLGWRRGIAPLRNEVRGWAAGGSELRTVVSHIVQLADVSDASLESGGGGTVYSTHVQVMRSAYSAVPHCLSIVACPGSAVESKTACKKR